MGRTAKATAGLVRSGNACMSKHSSMESVLLKKRALNRGIRYAQAYKFRDMEAGTNVEQAIYR